MDATSVLTIGEDPDPDRRIRIAWGESLADFMASNPDVNTRKKLRLALAERGIAVTEQAISYWLNGGTAPRPHTQAVLAGIFRVPVRRLFPLEAVGQ